MEHKGRKFIGIDLGTTNSCVAVYDGYEARVLDNQEGYRTTPSIVAITADGERLVGQSAKRQMVTNWKNTVFGIKRLMGRRFDDPLILSGRMAPPYPIVAGDNGDAWVEVDGRAMSPAQVSALILDKMRRTAEEFLGEPVEDAVITVPAYFNDAQRKATRDAGRIAGLNVRRIINEPTAAAIAYGLDKTDNRTVAVFDLGGGTFDISILEIGDGVFQVKATNGDTFLGGEDFDRRIVAHLLEEFQAAHGLDLRDQPEAMQRIREAAERAKMELSTTVRTEINLPFLFVDGEGPRHLEMTLSRAKLEDLVEDLIQSTLPYCRQALADAGLTVEQLDEVVLVGGMTRMPRVREVVSGFFGKEARHTINPDEAVAVGASLQGAVMQGEITDLVLLDVTPLSLGIEIQGGLFAPMIPRNTPIPCRETRLFSTVADYQKKVAVKVAQGERELFADNKTLGDFNLDNLPLAPRGVPQIEVSFSIDVNGLVEVSARHKETGQAQSIRVESSGGLGDAEIRAMILEAEHHRQADLAHRALAEACNEADAWLYATSRLLRELQGQLGQPQVDMIRGVMALLRGRVEEGTDLAAIRAGTETLREMNRALGEQARPTVAPESMAAAEHSSPQEDPVPPAWSAPEASVATIVMDLESDGVPDLDESLPLAAAAEDPLDRPRAMELPAWDRAGELDWQERELAAAGNRESDALDEDGHWEDDFGRSDSGPEGAEPMLMN
ncbi:MAG: molecular chaperone DnaK [Magnetococcales bacterium]|nr:molecular chaperone DnaK [Magnetococcales bacterium]